MQERNGPICLRPIRPQQSRSHSEEASKAEDVQQITCQTENQAAIRADQTQEELTIQRESTCIRAANYNSALDGKSGAL
jgi:hypothetical protein